MVSKNNRIKRQEQIAECKSHFAIRKLTIGAASVLLGTTLWLNNGNVVRADANSDKGDMNKSSQESSSSTTNTTDTKKVVIVTENKQESVNDTNEKNESQNSNQQTDSNSIQDKNETSQSSDNTNKQTKIKSELKDDSAKKERDNEDIVKKDAKAENQINQNQTNTNSTIDKDELARRKEAISTQVEKAKQNTAQIPAQESQTNQEDKVASDSSSISHDVLTEQKDNNQIAEKTINPILSQAGQQGKQNKASKSEQLDLFQIGEKGKVQANLTKDKNLENQEKALLKQKENILNIAATKEAALDSEKIKQLSTLSTEQVAQLYGTSLVQASSIKGIFDQLKGLDFSKIKDSVSQITSTINDPDVQKAAKDLMSGNFSLSTLSDLKKASSKIGSLTTGLKDLAGELSKNTSSDSSTGSILDKLKNFKLPDITKIKPAIDGINTAMKDPNVQKVIQDVTSGNIGSAIADMGTALPTIEQNLTPLNNLVKDATGIDVMDQVKSKLPNVDPTTLSKALSGITGIMKDPDVQKAIKDIASGSPSLSDVTAIPKIIKGLKPVGNIVKDLLPHKDGSSTTDPDKDKGKTSWFDKLKNLVPSFTDEEITAAKNAIQRTISDPLIKNVVTDVITQNYPKLLMDVIHYGPATLKNAKTSIEEITKAIKDAKEQKQQNTTYTYTINYMDGKTKVSSQQVSGKPGTTETITVQVPNGYEVAAGSSVPGTYTFTTKNESINISVVKKDASKPVDPDAKEHTLTINYVLSDGSAVGAPQTITGKTGESKIITAQIPAGYKLTNGTNIPGLYTFKDADDSIKVTVEKIENKPDVPTTNVVLTINYKDGDKVVGSQTVTGKAGSEVSITAQIPNGYKLSSTGVVPATYTLGNKDSSLDIPVIVDSSAKPDNPDNPNNPDHKPDNPDKKPDNPSVPDTPVETQKAQLLIVDQDDNNNQIKADGIETSFIAKGQSGDTINFGNTLDAVSALQKLGYELVSNDIPTDAKFDKDSDNDNISQIYQIIMRHGVQVVTAATDPSAIPAKSQGIIKPADLTKKVNLTVTYTNSDKTPFTGDVPENAKQTITFNGTVYVDKVTGKVVNAKEQNGNWVVDNDNLAIPEVSWKADNDEFSAVISPKEKGYKVISVSNYSAGDNVDKITKLLPTSGNISVNVVYAPDDTSVPTPAKQGSIKVIVFDQTTNQIMNDYGYNTGKVDEGTKVDFLDHAKQIQELENKGYDIVSDPTADLPTTVADADLTYRLIVKHHILSVSPENPATPGSLIVPGNPYNKYPSDTNSDSLTHVVTRTITYAGTPTEVTPIVDSLKFTAQGYLDAVTGKWTTADGQELQDQTNHYIWTSHDGTKFDKVTSPYFKNYHVANISVNGNDYGDVAETTNINQDSKNINVVVNYAPNGEIVPVDSTGKEIASKVQYVTNPANLTKVMPEESVPEVSGYTTEIKTVTPVDASVNTSVVYTAIPTKVKKGRVIVTVHDNTANSNLSDYSYDTKRRKVGTQVDFDKTSVLSALEKAGYKVLNSDVIIPQKVTKGNHLVTIYVEHDITPIKEDNNSKQIVLTKEATQTVHYEGAGSSTPQDNISTIKFIHKVSLDKVTGELIDNGWTPQTQTYKTVITPNVAGYTASVNAVGGDQVNANDNNLDRTYTVTYVKDPVLVMGNVVYIDDVTGDVLESHSFLGNIGDSVKYDPAKRIASYEAKGYQLTQNDLDSEKKLESQNNDFEIHFTHTTSKVDANNAADNYKKADLDKNISRVVEYVYADGSKSIAPIKQEVHLTASGTIDNVTGQLVTVQNGKIIPNGRLTWTAVGEDSFAEIPAINLDGYYISGIKETGTNANVSENGQIASEVVTNTTPNEHITITLSKKTPIDITGSVDYIDDTTNKTLEVDKLGGQVGQLINYNTANIIQGYLNKGYKLVSSNFRDGVSTFDGDAEKNNFQVHLAHNTNVVNDEKVVTRNVSYIDKEGRNVLPAVNQSVSFTGQATKDEVTGNLVNLNNDGSIKDQNGKISWTAKDDEFAAIAAVDNNYRVTGIKEIGTNTDVDMNTGAVASEKVSPTDSNKTIVILLEQAKANARVSYIDDTTGKVIETREFDGKLGNKINYDANSEIAKYENQGYKLVSSDWGKNVIFTQADNNYNIHLAHTTSNLDVNHLVAGYTKDDLTKQVTRTVNYVYADGSKSIAPIKQIVNFKATGTIDNVTGQLVTVQNGQIIPNGKLTWDNSNKGKFDEVSGPDLADYYISGINQSNSQATINDKGQVSSEESSPTSANINIVITLSKKAPIETSGTVIYYDDTMNMPIETVKLGGKIGQVINYDTNSRVEDYLKRGYKLVKNDLNKDQKFAQDSAKNSFEIHLAHTTSPVNDEKTVTRNVSYVDENGETVLPEIKQTVSFNGQATKDDVTGNLVNLNSDGSIKDQDGKITWTAKNDEFAEIPAVDDAKYTVIGVKENNNAVDLKTGKVASEKVTANADNSNILITLNKVVTPKGSITVVVHDETANKDLTNYGKSSGEEDTGSSFEYNLAGEIKDLENKGYKVINKDLSVPQTITAGDQKLVLYVEHDLEPVTNSKDVTRSINYVDENGNSLSPIIKQTVHFTQNGVKDKVTGEFTSPLTWDKTSDTVQNAISPSIDGYHVVKVSQDGDGDNVKATVLKNNEDSYDVFVTYAKDTNKPDDGKSDSKTDPVKPDDGKSDSKTDPVKPDDGKSDASATNSTNNTTTPDPVQSTTTSETTTSSAPQEETTNDSEPTESDPVESTSSSGDENEASNDDNDANDEAADDDVNNDIDSSDNNDSVAGQNSKTSNNWKDSFGPHAETLSSKNNAIKRDITLTNKNNNISSNSQNIKQTSQNQLPQTGDDNQSDAAQTILGLAAGTLSMIGLAGVKKRRKQD
ncbi:YSIRK-type signal peptide-containing protein [Lactobacillus sp. LL6]|uniref:mucin-binding protein n=1 Tax=Lactobacillus sp. LL6 TaxID=2596827 RepID=UPI00118709F9|nr:YSIRK-type signal peptide-containing protein [Lactobacillus sp. LL6]TSO26648.1 YSIRK-type signal peptide-containing protein [Lactobacillus sp. LL6]